MQVIVKRTLREFWTRHPKARSPLAAWYVIVDKAEWRTPTDAKATFGTRVDFVADNRMIFDVGGNKYRLIFHVACKFKRVLIKFIGTHAEYDSIDPETV